MNNIGERINMNRMRKVSRWLAFRRLFAMGLKKIVKKVGAQSDILEKILYICGGIYKKDRRMEINIKKVFLSVWRLVLHAFSRWRILSAYVVFSTLVLSGWYVDIIGAFSSQDDYAGAFRAQHGNLNIYNIMAFLIGTMFYICLMLYDYMRLRLDTLQGGSDGVNNTTFVGDINQTVNQNSQNSPAVANSPGATINYNIAGITEERCRAIFDEKWMIAARDFTIESMGKTDERMDEFRTMLFMRMGTEKKGFEAFGDPAFQFLLMDAQRAAATTERKSDYQVLSELLARRTQVGNDRKDQIHIKKAVEMLPYIPDEALLGLTLNFLLIKIVPMTGDISIGLKVLDSSFEKIIGDGQLPKGGQWVESLEACGLAKIAIGSFMSMNKSTKIMANKLSGYVLPGIKKDSKNYQKAVELLARVNLPSSILKEHELNPEYVRLGVVEENKIDDLVLKQELPQGVKLTIQIKDEQKKVLHEIFSLYQHDAAIKEQFEKKLVEKIANYHSLKDVMDWWDKIGVVFQITKTGTILANANANKYDSNVPIFEDWS